jgi:glycopeptide antibiotics resistance protein
MALSKVFILMAAAFLAWFAVGMLCRAGSPGALGGIAGKMWTACNLLLFLFACYAILKYTVLGRTPSNTHVIIFCASYGDEFWREMVMNMLLYFPLGLSLPNLIRRYRVSVLLAGVVSCTIEFWQYCAGTGVAQGTDVIMNTLGVAAGGIVFCALRRLL